MSDSGPSLVRPLGQFSINFVRCSAFGVLVPGFSFRSRSRFSFRVLGSGSQFMHALEFSTAGSPRAVAHAIEDFAHAVARIAPGDLAVIGARPGDIVKITGRTSAVARVEVSDAGHEGIVQIDGTIRSNCGAALDESIAVTPVEWAQAVAVRLAPVLSGGAAAAIVAP